MTRFAFDRMIEHPVAPLREGTGEGAQATKLWQDKRDSLRRSLAVVLMLRVNKFAQAAHSRRSLSVSAKHCPETLFFTSRASRHGR